MRVLVDTGVWSEALRKAGRTQNPATVELRNLVQERRVEIIGPVRQELLSGLREEAQFRKLESHLRAFPDLSLAEDDYVMAARFFNICRRNGVQGSNTDFLICAVSVRRQIAVFTTDKDFELFAKHLPVMLHQARLRR